MCSCKMSMYVMQSLSRYQAGTEGGTCMTVPYSTPALEEGGWSALRPWRLPSGKRPGDKVKFTLEHTVKDQRRCRGIRVSLLFFNLDVRWGWVVNAAPRPLGSRERDPVPLVQEAGWDPGPVSTGAENLAPPGFDPRTVQPVASRYTDCAIRVPIVMYIRMLFMINRFY